MRRARRVWSGLALGVFCLFLLSCGGSPRPKRRPMDAVALTRGAAPKRQADVAPDASFVVYVSPGPDDLDIFRLDSEAEQPQSLTRGRGDDTFPRVSPDGRRLAFLRREPNGQGLVSLWVMNSDGSAAHRLGRAEAGVHGLAWSPDGKRLLLAADTAGFLLVEAEGPDEGKREPAGWPLPPDADQPDWGADGRVIFQAGNAGAGDLYLFDPSSGRPAERLTRSSQDERSARFRPPTAVFVSGSSRRPRVFALRINGGAERSLIPVTPPGHAAVDPVLWPGGGSVLSSEREGWAILVRATTGGEAAKVVPADGVHVDPVFNADGHDLFFTSDAGGNDDIYVVDLADLTVANLTTNPEPDFEPDYAPATHRIVFVSRRQGNPELVSIDQSGLDEIFLAPSPYPDYQPCFSPDGSRVAFVSERAGSPDLWVVPAKGGIPERITDHDGGEFHPTWARNGTSLVFGADWGGRRRLWEIDLADSNAVPVPLLPDSLAAVSDMRPTASPDGKRIAFVRQRGGNRDIWEVNLVSEKTRPLVSDPDHQDDNPAWSEDGTMLAYQSGGAVNLFRRKLPRPRAILEP